MTAFDTDQIGQGADNGGLFPDSSPDPQLTCLNSFFPYISNIALPFHKGKRNEGLVPSRIVGSAGVSKTRESLPGPAVLCG